MAEEYELPSYLKKLLPSQRQLLALAAQNALDTNASDDLALIASRLVDTIRILSQLAASSGFETGWVAHHPVTQLHVLKLAALTRFNFDTKKYLKSKSLEVVVGQCLQLTTVIESKD